MENAVNGVFHGVATCFELALAYRFIDGFFSCFVDENGRLVKALRLLPFAGRSLEWSGRFRRAGQHRITSLTSHSQ